MQNCNSAGAVVTVGVDLGDKYSFVHVLGVDGEVLPNTGET